MNTIERPIIYGILVVALLFLWDARCSRNIGDEISVKVPEVKGTLQTSKPLVHKQIVGHAMETRVALGSMAKKGQNIPFTGKANYATANIDYKFKNDSINQRLLAERDLKIEQYKNSNDSLKTALFEKQVQPMDVSETLENDTIKINMLAKVSGTMHNVKFDYTIKPYKINIKTYSLFLGSTIGNNTTNGKTFVSPQIMYLNPSGMIFYGGRDLFSDTYNIGVAKKIFGFSRQVKK